MHDGALIEMLHRTIEVLHRAIEVLHRYIARCADARCEMNRWCTIIS